MEKVFSTKQGSRNQAIRKKSLLMKVKEESEKAGLKSNIQKTKIMASSPISSWQIDGKTMEIVINFIFLGSKITADCEHSHEIKRHLLLGRKAMTNRVLKKQRYYFMSKVPSSQSHGFSSSHVWMWELNHKEGWAPKNWCFWTVVLKTLESPLDCKEIKTVNPKGNQSWIFIGGIDAEVETLQNFDHLMQRANPLEKTLTLWKTEGRRRRGQQRMR